MNKAEVHEELRRAESLAQRMDYIGQNEDFLVRYLAVRLMKDTMDKIVPEKHRKVIEKTVAEINESIVIQTSKEEVEDEDESGESG